MLLTRRQPDKPTAAANKLCSIRTLNGVYTEFGIDPPVTAAGLTFDILNSLLMIVIFVIMLLSLIHI